MGVLDFLKTQPSDESSQTGQSQWDWGKIIPLAVAAYGLTNQKSAPAIYSGLNSYTNTRDQMQERQRQQNQDAWNKMIQENQLKTQQQQFDWQKQQEEGKYMDMNPDLYKSLEGSPLQSVFAPKNETVNENIPINQNVPENIKNLVSQNGVIIPEATNIQTTKPVYGKAAKEDYLKALSLIPKQTDNGLTPYQKESLQLGWYNATKGKDKNSEATKKEQIKWLNQIAGTTSQYKRPVDYIADLKRNSKAIIELVGPVNYNDLIANAQNNSGNFWEQKGTGAGFVPGQGSPLRNVLPSYVSAQSTNLASNKKTTTAPKTLTHGKVVKTGLDKATGKKVVQYADGTIEYQS